MKNSKRFGRVCADDGVRSKDVRTRQVPEYIKRTSSSKSGLSYENLSTKAMVCDMHARERWSEWTASESC